jgi:hypothetical protein
MMGNEHSNQIGTCYDHRKKYINAPSSTPVPQLLSFDSSISTASSLSYIVMATPYHIQSKNTKFYIVSTTEDKVDREVETKDGGDSISR